MGACRLARKHPSGLFLSWCGRKCNRRRGAGGLRAAAEGRATAVAPLPRASARRRDAGSLHGTGLERGAQRGDHGVGDAACRGGRRGSGQGSGAGGPCRAGRKEGRGRKGLGSHAPASPLRAAGAAPSCKRGGGGGVFLGSGAHSWGSPRCHRCRPRPARCGQSSPAPAATGSPPPARTGAPCGWWRWLRSRCHGQARDSEGWQRLGTGGAWGPGAPGDRGRTQPGMALERGRWGWGCRGPEAFGERGRVGWGCRGTPTRSRGSGPGAPAG